jgi:dipeptidyl aminopeptidase/acylaminoacyl peptidase
MTIISRFCLGLVLLMTRTTECRSKEPFTLDKFFALARVSDPRISPDGKWVVYQVTTTDSEKNTTTSTLWLAPVAGGQPRQLTTTDKHDRHPRFSPDSRKVLFESDRGGEETQLWVIDITGGEARPLTNISTGAQGGIWSPDGKQIAFISAVYPEHSNKPFVESDAANKKRKEEAEKNPVKARVFDRLFYRHWDSWVEGKRQHLFVMPADGGEPRDVTPGDFDAVPTSSTFSAGDEYIFSADGQFLLFTAPPRKDEAWNTNHDLWRVPLAGGEPENLTAGNLAADGCPRLSPDGRHLAYRRQSRPGYEADKWELIVADASGGNARSLTGHVDRSIGEFAWSADGKSIYYLAEEDGFTPLFEISLQGGKPTRITREGTIGSLSVASDGTLAFTAARMDQPAEVWVMPRGQAARNISQANAEILRQIDLPRPESVRVRVPDGKEMQMWILKPPGFDPQKKWPLAYLVHGGPQGAWEDTWSWRWNPPLWAAQGYVVALPNPRGSTGFGQEFVDAISADWGGKCFDDLMVGIRFLERQPYIDPDRMAAAGASFGGYMMNWFAGHTDKFKTLITHCGVYNFDSMYATTDELWFDEWEHGGPPWETRESYEKHSPHRFAKAFRTPMLIIHNDNDFRVPVSEGYQLFTTLQRLGVPSKLINFPDEGHWVQKPANSRFWHQEVFAWLKQYVPPGGR